MSISLNSFLNSQIYNTQTLTNPLYAAFVAGSTYYPPVFDSAGNCSTSVDPGGLFGWLIYARTVKSSPIRGASTDTYLAYSNPQDFINDLNKLSGATACLITTQGSGGTYSFFERKGNFLTATNIGKDFLYAWSYLAYGGTIVIAGTTAAFQSYITDSGNQIDVLMGQTANASLGSYLLNSAPVVGIFPSNGYTAANFDSFLGADNVSGNTVADRIFNIYGTVTKGITTTSLQTGTSLIYNLNPVADVAGAFANAKETNNYFLTVAGKNLSTPLNNIVSNPVDWAAVQTKSVYKKNRVNFYTYSGGAFLGLDLVGATSGANETYTSDDRIGVSNLKNVIKKEVTDILLNYVFDVNNAATRAAVTTEVQLYLESISEYLDPNSTQVTCDASNNTDNSSSIVVAITVKPIQSISEISIPITVSAAELA